MVLFIVQKVVKDGCELKVMGWSEAGKGEGTRRGERGESKLTLLGEI